MNNRVSDIAKINTRPVDSRLGGVPCPKCGTKIEMTLESLLVRRSFTCANPKCRTTLRLEESASKEALTAIKIINAKKADDSTRRGPLR